MNAPSGPPDQATLPPGRRIEVPGRGDLFVRDTGAKDNAPPVVLLHGWSATSDLNWLTSYEALERHARVIAFDHRGHGRGLRTGERFRLEDAADDVDAVLDVLGIERAVIVGYSMGGAVAQLVWRRHPGRMLGLVLCATAAEFRSSTLEHLVFASLTPTAALAKAMPAELRRQAAVKLMTSRDDRDMRLWAVSEVEHHDWRRILEAGSELGAFDSRRWIGGLDLPVAQVVTLDDKVVSLRRQSELGARLGGRSLHLVPGGHAVVMEDPARFVPAFERAVVSVIRRIG